VHDAWLGRGERVTVGNQTALIARVGHQLAVGGQVREHSTPGEGRHNCEIRKNCMVKLCAYVLLEINLFLFICLKKVIYAMICLRVETV